MWVQAQLLGIVWKLLKSSQKSIWKFLDSCFGRGVIKNCKSQCLCGDAEFPCIFVSLCTLAYSSHKVKTWLPDASDANCSCSRFLNFGKLSYTWLLCELRSFVYMPFGFPVFWISTNWHIHNSCASSCLSCMCLLLCNFALLLLKLAIL